MARSATAPATPKLNRWAILAASLAVMFCTGAMYSFSVLRDPIADEKGFKVSLVLLAYGINNGIAPVPMILVGRLIDKGYARWTALIGAVLFGLGWLITGLATEPWHVLIGYGVIAGFGQSFAYSSCLTNNMRLFPDKRGLASGLSIAFNGVASVIIAPLSRALIDSHGVGWTMAVYGTVFAAVGVAAWSVIRPAPAGFRPAGWTPPETASGQSTPSVTTGQMIRRGLFWMILLVFVCGAFSGVMIAANAAPIGVAMYGLTTAAAALAVSGYAAGKAAGSLGCGALSDRLGPARTLMVIFTAVVVLLAVLIACRGSGAGFAAAVIGLGVCFGGVVSVMPNLVAERFGLAFQGTNYGIAFGGYAVAALVSPQAAATLGAGGDYTLAFAVAIAAAIAGLGLLAAIARVKRPAGRPR
jgi:OFA family oxalate/formate antiporter-like MFS transporter